MPLSHANSAHTSLPSPSPGLIYAQSHHKSVTYKRLDEMPTMAAELEKKGKEMEERKYGAPEGDRAGAGGPEAQCLATCPDLGVSGSVSLSYPPIYFAALL